MNLIKVVQNTIDYIEGNLTGEIDYNEAARQHGLQVYDLRMLFSMVSGVTLGEYVRNRRLSESRKDLQESTDNILDIALKYGYNSPEGYTRAFYRYYSMTPSAARSRRSKLDSYDRISVQDLLKGDADKMDKLKDRGYSVKGSDLIYYTNDMDKTVEWFKDILGWYAGVDARNEDNSARYGCALPFPGELVHMSLADAKLIHFFPGEPDKRTIGFIRVNGVDSLYEYVTGQGWTDITEVVEQSWGGRTCHVTTIDGCVLMFAETIEK